MPQLVECVPNFSNGRDPEVYNGIADAIRSVPQIQFLSLSADPDHNRTVITFVGTPDAVEEAAFRGIVKAAELINLDEHTGEHPRIGATDVCPFIPVRDVTSKECAEIARRLGKRVGAAGIAVYLYADAATRPDRTSLSIIRKGEYEKWKGEVAVNPDRLPDFGPAEPKPWGATVIGARPFLVAYNIYLNTANVDIASKIARGIRYSTGGLRFVQAMGFLVEGQAQVSMNLTNFEKTPIYRVQELVKREAERYGAQITHTELIGLTPQKALIDAAQWYLQLDQFDESQLLEYQLMTNSPDSPDAVSSPDAFLAEVAASAPAPGGGSVAALAGALAAALTEMMSGLTTGRKKYADVSVEAATVGAEAAQLRQKLTAAIAADAAAFTAVMDAWKRKDLDEAAKAELVETATIHAGELPLQVARLSRDAAQLALRIATIGNSNGVTDAVAGVLMGYAAVQIAGLNVKINGVQLRDQERAAAWRTELDELEAETAVFVDNAKTIAARRGGF